MNFPAGLAAEPVLAHNVSIAQCVRAVGGSVRLENVTVHMALTLPQAE